MEQQMWKAVEQERGKLSQRELMVALTAMKWTEKELVDKACEIFKEYLLHTVEMPPEIRYKSDAIKVKEYSKEMLVAEIVYKFRKMMEI